MKNGNPNKIIKPRTLVVAVIFALTIFIVLADANRQYRSDINILVVGKSEIAAPQVRDITANMSEILSWGSFYEKLIKDNSDLRDVFQGLDIGEKKRFWNKMIDSSVEGDEDGSVLRISLFTNSRADATLYSKRVPETLFRVISGYYDVKEDLELRIGEGPLYSSGIRNPLKIVFESVLFGLILAFVFESFIFSPRKKYSKKVIELEKLAVFKDLFSSFYSKEDKKKEATDKKVIETKSGSIDYDISNYQEERRGEELDSFMQDEEKKTDDVERFRSIHEKIQTSEYPNFPEFPKREGGSFGGAPNNLPVADPEMVFGQPGDESVPGRRKEDEKKSDEKNEEKENREPTEEEIRERLNKLLKGDM